MGSKMWVHGVEYGLEIWILGVGGVVIHSCSCVACRKE